VQEAQEALAGMRAHAGIVEDAVVAAATLLRRDAPEAPDAGAPEALIVICSEHGFVGALNERLLDLAQPRAAGRRLIVVGRRGAALAAERGMTAGAALAMATHVGGVPRAAREIAAALAGTAGVEAAFAEHARGAAAAPKLRRILPLDPAALGRPPPAGPPLHHLAPQALVERLSREYLFAELARALMEALASENAARLRAMENADRNIDDTLHDLTRRARTRRQEAITSELLDVVTGADAILSGAEEPEASR